MVLAWATNCFAEYSNILKVSNFLQTHAYGFNSPYKEKKRITPTITPNNSWAAYVCKLTS